MAWRQNETVPHDETVTKMKPLPKRNHHQNETVTRGNRYQDKAVTK
jgi:hypothetical protein